MPADVQGHDQLDSAGVQTATRVRNHHRGVSQVSLSRKVDESLEVLARSHRCFGSLCRHRDAVATAGGATMCCG